MCVYPGVTISRPMELGAFIRRSQMNQSSGISFEDGKELLGDTRILAPLVLSDDLFENPRPLLRCFLPAQCQPRILPKAVFVLSLLFSTC